MFLSPSVSKADIWACSATGGLGTSWSKVGEKWVFIRGWARHERVARTIKLVKVLERTSQDHNKVSQKMLKYYDENIYHLPSTESHLLLRPKLNTTSHHVYISLQLLKQAVTLREWKLMHKHYGEKSLLRALPFYYKERETERKNQQQVDNYISEWKENVYGISEKCANF